MSIEVLSFDNFESLQQIEAQQANLIRVVLEGKEDVFLFAERWFVAEQETFNFVEASRIVAGSGCTSVERAVTHSRDHDGVPAIGIVDRDVLFRAKNWSTLYQREHDLFVQSTSSDQVHVASLWEIEAYLFDPDLIGHYVNLFSREQPARKGEIDTALEKTVAECSLLLDIAPYLAGSHAAGIAVQASYLCDQDAQSVRDQVAIQLNLLSQLGASAAAQVQTLVDQIKAELPGTQAEQLTLYLRYVDTKRLLQRLTHTLRLRNSSKWAFAVMQGLTSRRPQELEQFLETAKQRFLAA